MNMRTWLVIGIVLMLSCGFVGGAVASVSSRAQQTIAPQATFPVSEVSLTKGENLTWDWTVNKLSLDFWIEDPSANTYNSSTAAASGKGLLVIPINGTWTVKWENTQLVDPYTDNSIIVTYTLNVINHPPKASIKADKTSGLRPVTLTFKGSGLDTDGYIASYSWNFGDGGTSTAQNPSHAFTKVGTFTTVLTVTDNDGLTGTASIIITIVENKAPTAKVLASPVQGIVPVTVVFNGTGTDTDGTIKSYSWNFGDGGTSIEQNPTYKFVTIGIYDVVLTVKDDYGATGSATIKITVNRVPNKPPIPSITASPTSGIFPFDVQFTGKGTDSDGVVIAYLWDFGDGSTTSNEQNPLHTYLKAGDFTVKLKVTDNENATGNATAVIKSKVNQLPKAYATANATQGVRPFAVTFTGRGTDSDGTIASYFWDFGDGKTSNDQNPQHVFAAVKTYPVKLTVTDNRGGNGSMILDIIVDELPADGDADHDGMPNGWEMAHKLDPLKNDAALDPDKDGFSNLIEFQKATDPQDPLSHPITKGTMTVIVTTKSGTGLINALVSVTGPKAGTITTDANGKAAFIDYPLGQYEATVTLKDYKTKVAWGNITEKAPNPTVTIVLDKKPSTPHGLLPGFEGLLLVLAVVALAAFLGRRKDR
jgi:PKD repeat protein